MITVFFQSIGIAVRHGESQAGRTRPGDFSRDAVLELDAVGGFFIFFSGLVFQKDAVGRLAFGLPVLGGFFRPVQTGNRGCSACHRIFVAVLIKGSHRDIVAALEAAVISRIRQPLRTASVIAE
ncbi:hypothetical protein D3C75_904280 [compost metagenome]